MPCSIASRPRRAEGAPAPTASLISAGDRHVRSRMRTGLESGRKARYDGAGAETGGRGESPAPRFSRIWQLLRTGVVGLNGGTRKKELGTGVARCPVPSSNFLQSELAAGASQRLGPNSPPPVAAGPSLGRTGAVPVKRVHDNTFHSRRRVRPLQRQSRRRHLGNEELGTGNKAPPQGETLVPSS